MSNPELLPLVLATTNEHKANELRLLLRSLPVSIVDLNHIPDVLHIEETGSSLRENASIKARKVQLLTGLATVADDTGLEVKALGGAPGVHSARYAGRHADGRANRAKLLQALETVTSRKARFVTVIALDVGSELHFFEGHCDGSIAMKEMSREGFGYESIFVPDGFEVSMAQIGVQQKNAISHRGKAGRRLVSFLKQSIGHSA